VSSTSSTIKRCGPTVGAVLLLGAATAGCGVGKGAPDGWTYMNAHGIALAHPKPWVEVPAAKLAPGVLAEAVLSARGHPIADVVVLSGKAGRPRAKSLKVYDSITFNLDGKPATQVNYTYLALPPEQQRRVSEVTVKARDGRTMDVRITAYGRGNRVWQDTMNRIANSIQVGTLGKGNLVKA
jgi:hypothetical protein